MSTVISKKGQECKKAYGGGNPWSSRSQPMQLPVYSVLISSGAEFFQGVFLTTPPDPPLTL